MRHTQEQLEPLRYERKFLINDYSHQEVEQFVKFHPACFSAIFHERKVNNIYFDTLGLNNYHDNLDGQQSRTKVRIRWYGNLFGKIEKPVLEFKIKKGLLGFKKSYFLNSFILDKQFNKSQLKNILNSQKVPPYVKNELISLSPTLLNTYNRKYFLSADKKFRITIDHELSYYKINNSYNTFIAKSQDHYSTVLELKYDTCFETESNQVASLLPFALTKNSKYLQGLERIFI